MNEKTQYTIKKPFTATIEKVVPLNKEGSTKSNYHVEISIEGSGIDYEVGCSFGLLPFNHTSEVDSITSALKVETEMMVHPAKVDMELSIYDFFLKYVNVSRVTKKIAKACIPYQEDSKLEGFLDGDWKDYSEHHDLVQFLEEFYSTKMPISELVDVVCPKLARFYSIASSQAVVGDRIRLLVADFSYTKGSKNYKSITAAHLKSHKTVRLFHQANPSFYPPEDDTPIIMIGPGTGLAAFLGFIEERVENRGLKNNVLFTGDRNEKYDFYYENELKAHQESGNLQLFTAFSRDSSKKVYVQDRMWEQKDLLYDLIANKGAHIFVSGDADRMAKDVTLMLEKILATQTPEEAHNAVRALKKAKRLHMDVY